MDTIEGYISNFYLLEDMYSAEKPKNAVLRRRFIGWNREVAEYRQYFAKKIARVLRDSLAGMTLSELRWWSSKSYIEMDIEGFSWTDNYTRNKVLTEVENSAYSIYDVLALRDIFWYGSWFTSEYGGKSWARIIDRIKLYTTTPPILYCDYVFDTIHNGGIAFNKDFLVSICSLGEEPTKDLLYHKLNDYVYNARFFPTQMDSNVLDLLKRGCEIGVYKIHSNKDIFTKIKENTFRSDPFTFPTIKWNRRRTIKYKIISYDIKEYPVEETEQQDFTKITDAEHKKLKETLNTYHYYHKYSTDSSNENKQMDQKGIKNEKESWLCISNGR